MDLDDTIAAKPGEGLFAWTLMGAGPDHHPTNVYNFLPAEGQLAVCW